MNKVINDYSKCWADFSKTCKDISFAFEKKFSEDPDTKKFIDELKHRPK